MPQDTEDMRYIEPTDPQITISPAMFVAMPRLDRLEAEMIMQAMEKRERDLGRILLPENGGAMKLPPVDLPPVQLAFDLGDEKKNGNGSHGA